MPQTEIRVFKDQRGRSPFVTWFDDMFRQDKRVFAKCASRVLALSSRGRELRRPLADKLRGDIYELRFDVGNVNYRILYGFVGADIALLSHVITKTKTVPKAAIDAAQANLNLALSDLNKYTADLPLSPPDA